MKKVLVLASLGILALSFGCGGGASKEDKGKAGITYMTVTSFMSLEDMGTASLKIDTAIPEETIQCETGDVTISGTSEQTGTTYTSELTATFNDCTAQDDICETYEDVIMNGTMNASSEVTTSDDNVSIKMEIGGTINLTGMFISDCTMDLVFEGEFSEQSQAEDVEFTGTVCGVAIEDLLEITDDEIAELCEAVIAGGNA
jgi:hypothetical protein